MRRGTAHTSTLRSPFLLHMILFTKFKPFLSRCLGEGQASLAVRVVDLLDRVHVGGRAQVEPEVVLHCRRHDCAGRALHRVVQAGVDDVLFRSTLGRLTGDREERTGSSTDNRFTIIQTSNSEFDSGLLRG